ncbi:MAG: glutathione peroxidase [Zoogloeaceae bacterium]|nr:glutathione peroxidase [Zoogloeaceae bacterium]
MKVPALIAGAVLAGSTLQAQAGGQCPALLDHRLERLQDGEVTQMCGFAGKVILVVNTASFCGFTGQYEGLEKLYSKYRQQGLVVVGFPSNDFGQQEPGSNVEIAEFCRLTYGVRFPMFAKAKVRGAEPDSLFGMLAELSGERPRWNFHKYLIDRSGTRVTSFPSELRPDSRELVAAIERRLAER